jgi:hypothetical protein
MIVSSSDPTVASTTACVVSLGKTITNVSGSVPCSILRFRVDGEAIGFVDGCAATMAAAALSDAIFPLSISTAPVRGMLTNRT